MAGNTLNVHLLELMDTEANLTSNYTANNPLELGRLAFVRDSVPPTSTSAITRFKIGDGVSAFADLPWNNSTVPFGTCSTAAGTAAKTVDARGFVLAVGQMIIVKFTVTNTAGSPTLNVNGTGAKAIYYRGSAVTAGALAANRTYNFVYNGTQFDLIGDLDSNTTYNNASLGQGYGTCPTESSTFVKTVTLSGYALTVGGIVSVKFDHAISNVSTAITMNINSKGAKPVLCKNTAITNDIIKDGDIATFIYDGTSYHLISVVILPVRLGGTGKASLTANKILQGNGTNPVKDSLTLETSNITNTTSDAHVPSSKAVATYVTNALSGIVDAVVFKGTVAKFEDLPTTGVKVGWAYKTTGVVTIPAASSYTDAAVTTDNNGDTIIATATTPKWAVIPSGDDVMKISPGAGITTAGDDSSVAGDPITAEGTISLRKSGVTAGTYGPTQTSGVDGTDNTKINIPKITVDKYGRVTSATNIEYTSENDKVAQTNTTTSGEYRLIFSNTAGDNADKDETAGVRKSTNFKVNPSTGVLTAKRFAGNLNTGYLDQGEEDYLILDGSFL